MLDLVERHLRGSPVAVAADTACAYLVDEEGDLNRVAFQRPRGEAEREAIAAILFLAALETDTACVLMSASTRDIRLDAHVVTSTGVESARRFIRFTGRGGVGVTLGSATPNTSRRSPGVTERLN